MSDGEPRDGGTGNGVDEPAADGADDIETGEPIEALRALAIQPRPGFLTRIRASIERRSLAGSFADLTWKAAAQVVLEYLTLAFGLFAGSQRKEKGSD